MGMQQGFLDSLFYYFNWESLGFLLEVYICLGLSKWIYERFFYDKKGLSSGLSHELFEKDNPALAVSLAGYFLGVSIIIFGVLMGDSDAEGVIICPLASDFLEVGFWSIFGIGLLNISRVVNDRFILNRFSNQKEIVEGKNVGAGVAQFGSYVGSALVIQAILSYSAAGFLQSILWVLVYFAAGQVGFILFSKIYVVVVRYDFHAKLEKDNAATGIALGLNLTAIGILLSFPLRETQNLWVFLISFLNGSFLLFFSRWLLDKIFFHKANLDKEIAEDRNWGAAIIEGSVAIAIAFLVSGSFLG